MVPIKIIIIIKSVRELLTRHFPIIFQDILEFIEQSPHGVVYFTFGSIVKMSSLPRHVQKAFVEALARIPERVLWKYEGDIEDKPTNVMTKQWLPQREILRNAT